MKRPSWLTWSNLFVAAVVVWAAPRCWPHVEALIGVREREARRPVYTVTTRAGQQLTADSLRGKVVLVNSTAGLACNGGSAPCLPAQTALIVDLVGFGGANFFEGASATPTPSNTTAALRLNGGCTDTDNNGSDFSTGAPVPRNTASALTTCTATQPAVVTSVTVTPASASLVVGATAPLTAVARDASNNVVSGQSFTWSSSVPAVASVSVNGTVTAEAVGQSSIRASVTTANEWSRVRRW